MLADAAAAGDTRGERPAGEEEGEDNEREDTIMSLLSHDTGWPCARANWTSGSM